MTSDPPTAAVHIYLAAYVRRRRRLTAASAVGWAVALSTATTLLVCLADRAVTLPAVVRAASLAATVGAALVPLVRPILRGFRRIDPVAAAVAIERQHPAFAHRLVTVASANGSADLVAAVERDVLALIAATGPARVPRRRAALAGSVAALALLLFTVLWRWPWLDLPDLARRLARPMAPIAAVTSTRVTVRPGHADVVEGKLLTITAAVGGTVGPDGVVLHLSDDNGQTWSDRPMGAAGGGYAATLPDVDRDLRYDVSAGDAASPAYDVHVRRVPGVVAVRVRLDYPAALHRAAASTADLSVDAPAGTTVTVEVVATVPLRAATLTVGPDRIAMTPTADPCARRAQFVVRRDARVAVQLVSADGVDGTGPRSARVHVQREPGGTAPGFEQQQRAYRDALNRR